MPNFKVVIKMVLAEALEQKANEQANATPEPNYLSQNTKELLVAFEPFIASDWISDIIKKIEPNSIKDAGAKQGFAILLKIANKQELTTEEMEQILEHQRDAKTELSDKIIMIDLLQGLQNQVNYGRSLADKATLESQLSSIKNDDKSSPIPAELLPSMAKYIHDRQEAGVVVDKRNISNIEDLETEITLCSLEKSAVKTVSPDMMNKLSNYLLAKSPHARTWIVNQIVVANPEIGKKLSAAIEKLEIKLASSLVVEGDKSSISKKYKRQLEMEVKDKVERTKNNDVVPPSPSPGKK